MTVRWTNLLLLSANKYNITINEIVDLLSLMPWLMGCCRVSLKIHWINSLLPFFGYSNAKGVRWNSLNSLVTSNCCPFFVFVYFFLYFLGLHCWPCGIILCAPSCVCWRCCFLFILLCCSSSSCLVYFLFFFWHSNYVNVFHFHLRLALVLDLLWVFVVLWLDHLAALRFQWGAVQG